jgi:hypothetical protein
MSGSKAPTRSGPFTEPTFRSEFGLWLRHLGRDRLEREFSAIQSRFGTGAERPEDFESARAIGRQLRKLLSHSPR